MSEFSDLVAIVSQRRLRRRHFIEWDDLSGNKEGRLIELVSANPAITSQQLVKELYGSVTPANLTALRQLHTRAQDKLLNQLAFLDYTDARGKVSRMHEAKCRTLLAQAATLVAEGESKLSLRLAKRALALAKEAEFTELVYQALSTISASYMLLRKTAQYEQTIAAIETVHEQLGLERKAAVISNRILLRTGQSGTGRTNLQAELPAVITQLSDLDTQVSSYNTFEALFRVRLLDVEWRNDFRMMLFHLEQAAEAAQQGRLTPLRFDVRFTYYNIIWVHFRLHQFTQALVLAEHYRLAFDTSSTNWFYFYELYLLIFLHDRQYERAANIALRVFANPSLHKLPDFTREKWNLLFAYVELMHEKLPSVRRPRLSRLALPTVIRDKEGRNILLLIYRVVRAIQARNSEEMVTTIESLRKYQQRYLTDDSLLRSRSFLRLLLLLPEHDFSVPKINACPTTAGLLAILQSTPAHVDAHFYEIVPFLHLWEFIMVLLNRPPG